MVDRDLLRRKLAELATCVTQVSEYRDLSVERYRADWRTRRIALRERLGDFRRFEAEALRCW